MHLLCCDWLLSTRADLWHNEKLDGEKHSLEASRLNGFNKDLRSLQDIAFYISDAMPKVRNVIELLCTCINTKMQ
jgi:hypothetical protein